MILSQPWFWSQSLMSYGKMCTRVGGIDFDIKLKTHLKKLMPGFVPFYGAILLSLSLNGQDTLGQKFSGLTPNS